MLGLGIGLRCGIISWIHGRRLVAVHFADRILGGDHSGWGPFPGTLPRSPGGLWLAVPRCAFFYCCGRILGLQSSLALFYARLEDLLKERKWASSRFSYTSLLIGSGME